MVYLERAPGNKEAKKALDCMMDDQNPMARKRNIEDGQPNDFNNNATKKETNITPTDLQYCKTHKATGTNGLHQ
jgi:hypothetical protein